MIRSARAAVQGTVRHGVGRLALVTAIAAAAASSATVASAAPVAPAAGAGAARHAAVASGQGAKAVVVMVRSRPGFGRILVTLSGRALYVHPHGSCAGNCLVIWPRLVMPAGSTTPLGASCLGTRSFGSAGRLQVTYRKMRLYTFVTDQGRSVKGNNVDGFGVVRVRACAAPAPAPTPTPAPSPTGAW